MRQKTNSSLFNSSQVSIPKDCLQRSNRDSSPSFSGKAISFTPPCLIPYILAPYSTAIRMSWVTTTADRPPFRHRSVTISKKYLELTASRWAVLSSARRQAFPDIRARPSITICRWPDDSSFTRLLSNLWRVSPNLGPHLAEIISLSYWTLLGKSCVIRPPIAREKFRWSSTERSGTSVSSAAPSIRVVMLFCTPVLFSYVLSLR